MNQLFFFLCLKRNQMNRSKETLVAHNPRQYIHTSLFPRSVFNNKPKCMHVPVHNLGQIPEHTLLCLFEKL